MTKWVTQVIGVKDIESKLSKEEYGSIIVDLRDVIDGANDPMVITRAFNRVFATAASAKKLGARLILQCEGGLSRSPLFVAAIFMFANDLSWEDAIDLVKKKVPEMQVNQRLLDSFKVAFGQVQLGQ